MDLSLLRHFGNLPFDTASPVRTPRDKTRIWGVSVRTHAHTPKCGTLHPEGRRGRRENPREPLLLKWLTELFV
jgi:hypothetical protein